MQVLHKQISKKADIVRALDETHGNHHMSNCEELVAHSSRIYHLRKSSLTHMNQSEDQKIRRRCKSYTNELAKRQTRFIRRTKHLEIMIGPTVKNQQHIHPKFTICINHH
jgi:tRNA A37 N6-isopentenylltransferase MiaA